MCINNSKSFMQISVKQGPAKVVGVREGEGRGDRLTVIAARCKSSCQEQQRFVIIFVCVLFLFSFFVSAFS